MLPVLDQVTPFSYEDPWNQPLPERLQQLCAGKRRIAYFYELADNSTFRYRVYNMAQVLNQQPDEVSASYFFLNDLHALEEIVRQADMLVICRARYDWRINQLITTFRNKDKPVLFDVDDLVFNTDYSHLLLTSLAQDVTSPLVWNDWFASMGRIGATLKMCDGAITTNEFLAEQLAQFARVPVAVVPNFINREQMALSDQVFAAKQETMRPANDGYIHLGYFSGSPSHNRDFALATGALEAAMEEDERLGVVLVGYIEPPASWARFGLRVHRFPFHDYVNLQRLIGSVEFNIMPLQYNTFTNCKSELKYFEAAVVGTLSIASPSFTYARAIRHGDNGYLAQAHQWLSAIRHAVSNIDDYAAMARRARDDARGKYAWTEQRATILAALSIVD